MKARAHIFVSGRVQGVFFRQNTLERAKSFGLFGWVRNTEDGRVEAVFEGDKEKIEKIIEWMKVGPPLSKVENVEVLWEDYKGEFDDFEIKYNF
jgi:acylphosphatase